MGVLLPCSWDIQQAPSHHGSQKAISPLTTVVLPLVLLAKDTTHGPRFPAPHDNDLLTWDSDRLLLPSFIPILADRAVWKDKRAFLQLPSSSTTILGSSHHP